MELLPLKYISYAITMQEVPDEVSLVINISGCPHKCEGCHSQYLSEYSGHFVKDDLDRLINQYDGFISCICFMGGDQNIKELNELLKYIKEKYRLKTSIYSGSDDFNLFKDSLKYLDWLKIGSYKKELSCDDNFCYGVKLATSNQKLYKKGIDYN